jgi:hypothetical protein
MPRGRKPAAASFTVVPLVPGAGRPDPPAGLDGVEKRIWTAIVGSLPDHWIDAAGEQILRRAVSQCAIAERREAKLRALRAQDPDRDDEVTAELEASHRATAKSVGHLLGLLRATPRSRVVSRDAGPKLREVPRTKPWDVKARG